MHVGTWWRPSTVSLALAGTAGADAIVPTRVRPRAVPRRQFAQHSFARCQPESRAFSRRSRPQSLPVVVVVFQPTPRAGLTVTRSADGFTVAPRTPIHLCEHIEQLERIRTNLSLSQPLHFRQFRSQIATHWSFSSFSVSSSSLRSISLTSSTLACCSAKRPMRPKHRSIIPQRSGRRRRIVVPSPRSLWVLTCSSAGKPSGFAVFHFSHARRARRSWTRATVSSWERVTLPCSMSATSSAPRAVE